MKIIKNVELDTSNLSATTHSVPISIIADPGAVFSLIIRKNATHWYDFDASPAAFVTSEKILSDIVVDDTGRYNKIINIPTASATTTYSFLIIANSNRDTKHAPRKEVRDSNNNVNENASTGSDSDVLTRSILQYTDTTIEIIGISFGSSGNYSSVGSAEVIANPGNLGSSIYFQLAVELGSSDFIKVRDPFDSDFMGFKQATITRITGEDTGKKIFVVSEDDYGDGFEKGMMVRHANISGGVGTVEQSFDGEKGFSFTTEEPSVVAGNILKFYSKNNSGLKKLFDTELSFSNLTVELTDVSTTVNDTDCNGSASLTIFDVASATGIKDDFSTVHGVNITTPPTVTNISSNTLTVSAAQVLQNGQALTFKGSSRVATIKGYVSVITVGTNDFNLLLDLDAILTVS